MSLGATSTVLNLAVFMNDQNLIPLFPFGFEAIRTFRKVDMVNLKYVAGVWSHMEEAPVGIDTCVISTSVMDSIDIP